MDNQITHLGEFLFWGVLGAAAFLLTLKAATGRINLQGLLQSGVERNMSAARVQLLLLTLIAAFGYLGIAVTAAATLANCSPDLGSCSLPDVPTSILATLGGSSGFYLGAKGLITGGWLDRLRGNGVSD
jgi:hypothetical protein